MKINAQYPQARPLRLSEMDGDTRLSWVAQKLNNLTPEQVEHFLHKVEVQKTRGLTLDSCPICGDFVQFEASMDYSWRGELYQQVTHFKTCTRCNWCRQVDEGLER